MFSEDFAQNLKNLNLHAKKLIWKGVTKHAFRDPKHITLSHNLWTMIMWNADEVPHFTNDSKLISKLDKILKELTDTDRKTTAKPEMIQLINGQRNRKILKYQDNIPNILTNPGLEEMAKRSTGASNSINSHHAIGTGIGAETPADTTLGSEAARKLIGATDVANQTERYGSAFADTDLDDIPSDITEAGILNAENNGVLILRVTSDPFTLSPGRIFTVQTNVTHQNGTEI